MKKLAMIFMIALLACSVVFAQGSSEAAPAEEKTDGQRTIAMTWWGDTRRHAVYEGVIDAFEAKHPDVKVERPYGSWSSYFDKLSTQMAGGVAPDLIGMHQSYISEYASRGALLDLTPYVENGILDISDIPESIIKNGTIDGKLYMIPQGLSGSALGWYTKTFDDLGLEYPADNKTWSEWREILVDIKEAAAKKGLTDFWATADISSDIYPFSYYARSKGETLFTADGNIGFTRESVVEWFNFWKDLRENGLCADPATSVEYATLPLEQSLLATGKVAFNLLPISQVRLYQALVEEGAYKLTRFPNLGGVNPEYISGASYVVNADSKYPEDAVALMNFFLNDPEGQAIFRQEQGLPPASKAIAHLLETATEPEKESIRYVQTQLTPNASPEPFPPAGYNEIKANFNNFATSVAFGEMSVEEAADAFMAVCKDVLGK